jgi:ATP-dependent Lon protease
METLHVPEMVPVMTLPNTVLFPQALLPLHIFEPRYRKMLRDVLANDRLFAIAQLDSAQQADPDMVEPLHHIASLGIVRACQKGENDTSNLLLQGICRVEITAIVREAPYRIIAVQPVATPAGTHQAELEVLRLEVMRLLNLRRRLGSPLPKGMTQFLESIDDVDTFADIAVFNLCEDSAIKQQLLETLETRRRLQLFAASLKSEIEAQRLRRKLQGHLPDDHIVDN